MEISVRKYSQADLPAMLSIWNEVVEAGLAFPQEQPEDTKSGAEFFASQTYCAVAADATGSVLGLYILHPNNIGRCGHIANASYAVAKAARGRGIGAELIKDSLEKARELGFRILQFNAVTSDNPANSLYKRLGFQPLGTIPGGFRRNDNEYADIYLYYCSLL